MAEIKFTNNAVSILSSGIAIGATSLSVTTGEGDKFPTLGAGDWFYLTLEEAAPAVPAFPLREIVKVTARTGDTMTVTRAQEGTTARAWLAGDKAEQRITKQSLEDLRSQWRAESLQITGGTLTGNLNTPSLNGGPLAGFRNRVINGAFDVWQRGTSGFTTAGKCADMWNISWDGTGGSRSISRQTHAAGEEIEGKFQYLRWSQAAYGTATWNSLENLIEYVRTLNGKTFTLSFWAKADAARTVNFFVRQLFGTGGSTNVDSNSTAFNLTTGWQKFTYTGTMPSVSGKTIGADSKLGLIFLMPATTFTIDITNVQLEEGSLATPFEWRPYSVELSLCQRYLHSLFGDGVNYHQTIGHGYQWSTTISHIHIVLPSVMRSSISMVNSATWNNYQIEGPLTGGLVYPTSANLQTPDYGNAYPTRMVKAAVVHGAVGAAGNPVSWRAFTSNLLFSSEI